MGKFVELRGSFPFTFTLRVSASAFPFSPPTQATREKIFRRKHCTRKTSLKSQWLFIDSAFSSSEKDFFIPENSCFFRRDASKCFLHKVQNSSKLKNFPPSRKRFREISSVLWIMKESQAKGKVLVHDSQLFRMGFRRVSFYLRVLWNLSRRNLANWRERTKLHFTSTRKTSVCPTCYCRHKEAPLTSLSISNLCSRAAQIMWIRNPSLARTNCSPHSKVQTRGLEWRYFMK